MTSVAKDSFGVIIQALKQGRVHNVSYSGTAGTMTIPVGTETTMCQVVSTTDCYYKVGANPTATASDSTYLPAFVVMFVPVRPSEGSTGGDKISFIRVASDGTANITEAA